MLNPSSAYTIALPPLKVAGQQLKIVCDLSREQGMAELLAALTAWTEISQMSHAQVSALQNQGIRGKNAWNTLAMQRFRQALRRQQSPKQVAVAVDWLKEHFFSRQRQPQLLAALTRHFHLEPTDGQSTQTPSLR